VDEVKNPDLLSYLPAIYQEQAEKETPLRALLFIFDHVFSEVEKIIDKIDTYFDPSLTSTSADKGGRDFLSWLASWVALKLDEGWSEGKKRYLIQNAAQLYRYRGTLQGLKHMLDQFLDIKVDIREWSWPQGMEIGKHSAIGIDTFLAERPNLDHCFEIIWRPPSRDIKPELEKKIRSLIDLEKPAHTKCYLYLEFPEKQPSQPRAMIIGIVSTIGSCYIDQEVRSERRV